MTRYLGFATVILSSLATVTPALAQDSLTVGYFQEWPMPYQYAKAEGIYDEALGFPVDWVAFDSGTAMSAAMAAGDVQIAIAQGPLPFIGAVSAGQDLRIVDIAATFANNENCVVASQLEIDRDSASELEGKRVALPLGTGAHYTFLKLMEHLEVDTSTMTVVDMAPSEGAAAFSQGSVDMACGWGGALDRMEEFGNILLTGTEREDLGILSLDLTTTTGEFAAKNPELLADFMAVTVDANAMWNAGEQRDEMLPVIAKDAGMDEKSAADGIDDFVFLPLETALSEKWLGGNLGKHLDGVAQLFHEYGTVAKVLPDYGVTIETAPLQDVSNR